VSKLQVQRKEVPRFGRAPGPLTTQAVIFGEGHNSCNIDAGMGFRNGVMGARVQKLIQARV